MYILYNIPLYPFTLSYFFVSDLFHLYLSQSPADRCKKIHAGDEVIQVNHQTVVRVVSIICILTLCNGCVSIHCVHIWVSSVRPNTRTAMFTDIMQLERAFRFKATCFVVV